MKEKYYLRDLQLTELKILKEFKKICEKYHLTYYLSGGTLLGGERHKGFIPWDDDIDVMMPMDSYTRFLEVAQKELKNIFVQNHTTDLQDHQAFTKLRLNDTAMILPNHKNWKIHQGVWIDIFPLIMIKDEKDFKKKKKLLSLSNFIQMDSFLWDNEEEFKTILKILYYPWRLFLKIPIAYRVKLHSFLLKKIYGGKTGDYCSESWGTITHMYKKEIFEGTKKEILFEDEYFSVMPGYKEYLEQTYGDYMKLPPVEQRIGHGDLIVDLSLSYAEINDF